MRLLLIALLAGCLAGLQAELLPEALGEFERKSVEPVEASDVPLLEEFGFEQAERAVYETASGQSATITATRYYDDTGAFAAFQWLKPEQGQWAEFGKRAWQDSKSTLIQLGNYLVEMEGDAPVDEHVELMLAYLPKIRVTVDPPMLSYVPQGGLQAKTERYILGPVALERLAPEISPSAAGFRFGAEGHYALYDTESGPLRMLLLSYPTPQMAREQIELFRDADGIYAKRDGPMIAAVVEPPSPDAAERLLGRFRYEAEVTMDYKEAERHDDPYLLIMDIVILCGILIGLCILGGVFVAGGRYLAGRVAPNSLFAPDSKEAVTRLHLDD